MLKHLLTGLAIVAVAGAVASCGGSETKVVYTPSAVPSATVVTPGVTATPGTIIVEDD